MASKKWSNLVVYKCNKLADIIRQRGKVSRSELMVLANMGSSTLYAYQKVLLELYKDIKLEDDIFIAEKG